MKYRLTIKDDHTNIFFYDCRSVDELIAVYRFVEEYNLYLGEEATLGIEQSEDGVLYVEASDDVWDLFKAKTRLISDVFCEWGIDEEELEGDVYSTSCGQYFMFFEGNPLHNNYKFCPSCGKPVKLEV
ncbi:MAG: hypothetical protein IM613_12305 [Cytophagales bacterium]|nr:hypothetical protein [Cytophagales bacterium]